MSAYDDWLNELCNTFRQQCDRLAITPEMVPAGSPSLFGPCQFYVVGCTDPSFQYLLITRNQSLPDLERYIEVDVPAYEFIEALDRFKDRSEFQIPRVGARLFPPLEGRGTLATFLDRCFSSFLTRRWPAVVNSRPGLLSYLHVGSGVSLYEFRGRLTDQHCHKFASEMVSNLQATLAPPKVQVRRVAQSDGGLPACGAYIYPSAQIGERLPLSFRQRASGILWDPRSPKVVLRSTFRKLPMCVDIDGLVMMITDDRAKALERLNRLMAGLLFVGLPAIAVREGELIQGTVHPGTLELTGSTASLGSLRNLDRFDVTRPPVNMFVNKISKAQFEAALATVDAMTREQRMAQDLLLFLEGTSHLADQEYTPAFLMGWTILERQLSAKWRRLLLNSGVTRDRIAKLNSAERWSVDYLIECLDLFGELPVDGHYDRLMALKESRNHIVHRGRPATEDEAREILDLAHGLIAAAIAQSLGPIVQLDFKRTLRSM